MPWSLWSLASRGFFLIPYLIPYLLVQQINGIPIDNGVIGTPEVACESGQLRVHVDTQRPFAGHVFVKGHFVDPLCHVDRVTGVRSGNVSLEIAYGGTCGVIRERSVSPAGISYKVVVVVQFHPVFSTKVDKAYQISCFYMEAAKMVTNALDVSMVDTTEVAASPPMPQCRYSVHSGSLDGPEIRYAKIGDQLFHKWSCDGDTYGMLVHTCFALDSSGQKFQLLDRRGCATDPVIMADLMYNGTNFASTETHAFKFADQLQVAFQCQISLCILNGGDCGQITPPICTRSRFSRRHRRNPATVSAEDLEQRLLPTMDVGTAEMLVLNEDDQMPNKVETSNFEKTETNRKIFVKSSENSGGIPTGISSSVCMTTLALTQGVVALSIIFTSIGIAWLIWNQRRKN